MTSIDPGVQPPGLLRQQIHRALKALHHPVTGKQPLGDLQLFQEAHAHIGDGHRAMAAVLDSALEELHRHHPDAATLLHARYVQNRTAADVASKLDVSDAELFRRQQRAIGLLAAIVRQREDERVSQARALAFGRLEAPTYAVLVGAEPHLDTLQQLLSATDSSPLICITGLGGVGKTALADALIRRLIDQGRVSRLAWVTARQRTFRLDGTFAEAQQPALARPALIEALWNQLLPELPAPANCESEAVIGELEVAFRTLQRTVAVVDNLETAVDLSDLLPVLRRLAHPVKFVLTTRESPFGEGYVYHYPLRELSVEDAAELIRREARARNVPDLVDAGEDDLRRIVDLVGGHPLALRLIVGRALVHALDDVLAEVRQAEGKSVENLYTHIYWRTWQSLGDVERDVLLAMSQVAPGGGTLELLGIITQLPAEALRDALARLVAVNLVDRRGDRQLSRYSIHSLTRTFLLRQVLDWQ